MRQLICACASDGSLNLEESAEIAETSICTMQRRLAAGKTSFSKLPGETCAQMARALIGNPHISIAETADWLGYERQGDFSHAFQPGPLSPRTNPAAGKRWRFT